MDYVTRQFINLTKKFRKELPKLSALLHRDLHQHKKAITAKTKRDNEQDEIWEKWREDVFSKYEESERDRGTRDDRSHRIQNSIRRATWCAFLAATIYAGITAYYAHVTRVTLDEIKRQTPYFAQSASASDTSAKNQTKAFNSEQRAWVVPIYTGLDQAHPVVANAPLAHFFNIINTGKTPAIHVEVVAVIDLYGFDEVLPLGLRNYSHESGLGTDRRSYSILWPQMLKPDTFQSHKNKFASRGYFIEDATYKLYTQNKLFVAFFGQITYDDIQGHSHWVHFCGTDEFAQPVYLTAHDPRRKCLEYNAVDSDPE